MSGPIQQIPQGLLGLLQLKQTGRNPSELSDTVAGTIDMFQLWVQRQLVDVSLGSSIALATATPGQFQFTTNPIKVPNGQAWWVDNFSMQCNLLAAEFVRFTGLLTPNPGIAAGTYRVGPDATDAITARARMLMFNVGGFWLGPGQGLGIAVYDVLTAATITVNASVRGVAVPI